ncbi:hypothetical protein B0H17DRAFT_1129219 [Mycena rosella]|uniref:Uncharacterized protein n=1 Tax=Mycena rosella TaxID=1033263 RepID=A0AAD7GKQ2_MYCRO|nr:hypothetical protein B0H17DRAFT_1129219 [Mycena rosella]
MPPTHSELKLWTPRLHPYPEDATIWAMEPIKTAFGLRLHGTTSTRTREQQALAWDWTALQTLLTEPYWVEFSSDWLTFSIGGEVTAKMPAEALLRSWDIILGVLYLRFSHLGSVDGDELAGALLLQSQMDNFRTYVDIPADFCFMDDVDDRDNSDGDSEGDLDTDSTTDADFVFPDVDNDEDDEAFTYIDDNSSDYDEEMPGSDHDEYIPDFTQTTPISSPAALPGRLPGACNNLVQLPEIMKIWCAHMQVFFYPVKYRRSKQDIVDDLVDMRKLRPKIWRTPEFQTALEESGLLDMMYKISKPGNLLETTHPDVEQSFRFHNWKRSYPLLICRWTRPTITGSRAVLTELQAKRKPDPNYKFGPSDAIDLLVFISSHREMHPWVYNPMAVFLLLSRDSFVYNSELWLAPALETLDYPRIQGWDAIKVYRTIMQLPLLMDAKSVSSMSFLAALKDRKLALVVSETHAHRKLIREVRQQVWCSDYPSDAGASAELATSITPDAHTNTGTSPSKTKAQKRHEKQKKRKQEEEKARKEEEEKQRKEEIRVEAESLGVDPGPEVLNYNCPNCKNEDAEDRCLREIQVFERPDAESLIGAALTCAPPEDRLKPSRPTAKTRTSKKYQVRYVNPETKGFKWVKPREQTQKRCGRDINRFFYVHDNGEVEWLGGVRYKAMQQKLLDLLIDNHRRVKVCGVRRRESMQAWSYEGSMTATGTRQAQGGLQGDVYGPYACHKGDTEDDIKALFRHATDADVLVEIGTTIMPTMRSDIAAVTNSAAVGRLGRHGLTSFYCTNYISAVHRDFDVGRRDIKPDNMKGKGREKGEDLGGCYPCVQLVQTGTDKSLHEWDFAMVRWGIVIETHSNTVWCFNGRHEHGSVIPSRSSYEANAASSGYHPTDRKLDVERAEVFKQRERLKPILEKKLTVRRPSQKLGTTLRVKA